MNKFIRYWNQNRIKIIIAIIIIVFLFCLIHLINILIGQTNNTNTINKNIEDIGKPTESLITGAEVSIEQTNENIKVIKNFVDACNSKEYAKAYSLLSEECKKYVFNTVEIFTQNYCNKIFETGKTYTLDLWYNSLGMYTYKIGYLDNNILETGNINTDSEKIEDYITVIYDGEASRLNVSGFVYAQNVGRYAIVQDVEIVIDSKAVYRNYEQYSITVKNKSNNPIQLNDGQNSNYICLVDQNGVEYNSILHEIANLSLEIRPGYQRTFHIKFNKMYNLYRVIDKIKFKNVILNTEDNQSPKVEISIKL